jgi:phage tail sheath protein FI
MSPSYLSPGVYVEVVPSAVKAIAGVGTSTPAFVGAFADKKIYLVARDPTADTTAPNPTIYKMVEFEVQAAANEPLLITSWTQFTTLFGDLVGNETAAAVTTPSGGTPVDIDTGQHALAHAVYGFFNNGGSSCYVMWIATTTSYDTALKKLEVIDDISLVAIPGVTSGAAYEAAITHCENLKDRFAILDGPSDQIDIQKLVEDPQPVAGSATRRDNRPDTSDGGRSDGQPSNVAAATGVDIPRRSEYAAWYFPCIKVFDPAEKLRKPGGDGTITVPPSGHIAGIYARVDGERGVHKAPANEVIRGALGVSQAVSKADQDNLNPKGVNCIRTLNGNIYVWGARTRHLDADRKYINVQRTLIFIQESIDQGTQWVVFEPNTPLLWQKIIRNVTAFLTQMWRSGALFGTTPQEAFFVRCDAELNPPDQRELGQVVAEVGVAIARPAEFVIFRISQFSAPTS